MPSDPNQNMDDLLKTYAQARRKEADLPVEMHPATRRLLQAEVARSLRRPGPDRASEHYVLANLWPRLLIGAGCVGVLMAVAGAWLRWDKDHDRTLASLGQQSNLYFFAESAPGQKPPQAGPETNTLSERVRGFELSANQQNMGGAPNRAVDSAKARAARAASSPQAQEPGSLNLALATPPERLASDADWASNGPLLASGMSPKRQAAAPIEAQGTPASPSPTAPADAPNSLRREEKLALIQETSGGHRGEQGAAGRSAGGESIHLAAATAEAAPDPLADSQDKVEDSIAVNRADQPTPAAARVQFSKLQAEQAAPSVAQSQSTGRGLYFQQVDQSGRYRRNLNSPPAPKVLTAFELRRSGDTLQVLDADGSVYEGSVQPSKASQQSALQPPSTARFGDSRRVEVLATATNAQPDAEPFTFRAEGTNRTLQQRIVFTGEFEPSEKTVPQQRVQVDAFGRPDAATSVAREHKALTPAAATATQPARQGQTLTNAPLPGRIEGRAAVGARSEIKIEAQQVQR